MTTSGTYNFDPKIAECMDEAWERINLDPSAIGGRHIKSVFRSLKFMLNSEWITLGFRQWLIVETTKPLAINQGSFVPTGPGFVDIFDMVLRRSGNDTECLRISRDDYMVIATKTLTGTYPDRFFYDKAINTVFLWEVPIDGNCTLVYNYLRRMQDPGGPNNTLDMPDYVKEAFIAGLTARLAEKWAPALFAQKMMIYCGKPVFDSNDIGGALRAALDQDRDKADVQITTSYTPRYGRF